MKPKQRCSQEHPTGQHKQEEKRGEKDGENAGRRKRRRTTNEDTTRAERESKACYLHKFEQTLRTQRVCSHSCVTVRVLRTVRV